MQLAGLNEIEGKEVTQEEMGASPTCHPGAIDHLRPLLLIGGDFDVVAVGALVTVPQQQPEHAENNHCTQGFNAFHFDKCFEQDC